MKHNSIIKIRKVIIVCSSLFAIFIQAQNQTNSQSIIQNAVNNTAAQSPNAAALFRYSETPVSLYTGVPDINIPLYTIKEGDIEIPISISYHAGGIKVNDEASSVGLGWVLNAGGRVSHIMAGANDFSSYGYYNIYPKSASAYIGSVSGCPTPPWNNSTAVKSFYSNDFRMIIDPSHNTLYPEYDFQPDLFLVNLPNKSYNAYLDMLKTTKKDYPKFAIVGQPNIDFKLIPNSGSVIPHSLGNDFKVIDEVGVSYIFDGPQESSTPYTGSSVTGVSNYLTKIEDTKGHKVNFYYSSKVQSDRLAGCKTTRYHYTYPPNDPNNPGFYNTSPGLTKCSKQTIEEHFIDKIEFTNGKIEFVWAEREDVNKSKKLSFVKIYNNYKLIKQYDFTYDYFISTDNLDTNSLATWLGAPNNNIFTHRLRLLSLTESLTNEKHTFDYNITYNLPNKMSFSSDFWGYYNGQANSDSFIPAPDKYIRGVNPFVVNSFNQDQSGYWYNATAYYPGTPDPDIRNINFTTDGKHYLADRRASLNALAGILTKINYPTGGKTEFEYELNTFSNYPIQSLMDNQATDITRDYSFGGGVRIKNIITTDNQGASPIIKNYIYDELNDNGSKFVSNGNLSEFPKFYEIENRCYITRGGLAPTIQASIHCPDIYTPNIGAPDHPFKVSVYEGGPSQGLSTLPQGGAIGYSKVIEQIAGKGRTESFFTNNYNSSCLSMIPRGLATNIGNGNKITERYYDNSSLIKEIKYNYKFNYPDQLNTYFISAAILEPVTTFTTELFSGVQNNTYPPFGGLIHTYSINLYKSLLESTTTKEYFKAGLGNYLETKTFTTYNNKYLPSIQKTIYPDTSISETTYNYAQEKGNQLLISKNMLELPLEIINTKTINGITKTISKTETAYPTILPDGQTENFALPKSVTSYDFINESPVTEINMDKYESGNLVQYTTKEGIPVSVIWGYNRTLPIARIEGAKYNDIAMHVTDIISKSNEDALNFTKENSLLAALDNLRKNASLANYQITTYTYDPLIGVTSITPPSGLREYYKYDTTNRLEKVVDVNSKILKEFKYRYGTNSLVIYSNAEKSQIFTRTNCTGNTEGGSYNYIVPSGTYKSNVSQLAADQEALDDISINGQNMADQSGPCISIVSCSFTFSQTIGNPQYSYNGTTITNGKVKFQLSFSPRGIWQNWSGGIDIGKVGLACAPSVDRIIMYTEGSRQWQMYIDTSGNCTAKLISGTVDPSSQSPLNFNFYYQK